MGKREQTISGLSSFKEIAADAQKRAVKPETATIISTFIGHIESILHKMDAIIEFERGNLSENDLLTNCRNFSLIPVEVRINELIQSSGGYAVIRRRFRAFVDYRIAITKLILVEYGDNRDTINGLAKMFGVNRASIYHYKNMTIYPEIKMIINQLNTQHNEHNNNA